MKPWRKLLIISLAALISIMTMAVVPAWAQGSEEWSFDFESGIPPEFTLALGPSSCIGEVAANLVPAPGPDGNGLREAAPVSGIGDAGIVGIVFPNLVDLTVASADILKNGAPAGLNIMACGADGSLVDSFAAFNSSDGSGSVDGDDIAAVYFLVGNCAGPSCTDMGGNWVTDHVWLDNVIVEFTDTGEDFDHSIFSGIGFPAVRPATIGETLGVSDAAHPNQDIVTTKDANVHSAFSGIVTILEFQGQQGVLICADDVCALYSGLGEIYVTNGMQVGQGCVIAKAGPAAQGAAALNTPGAKSEFLFTVSQGDEYFDWTEWPDPASNEICQDLTTPNCLTDNPHLGSNGANWADGGTNAILGYGVSRSDGSLKISGKAYVYQQVILEPDVDYFLTLAAAPGFSLTLADPTFTNVHITLGDAETDLKVEKPEGSGPNQYRIVTSDGLHPTEPNFGENTFTLKIGPADAKVGLNLALICLHTASDLVTAPSACFFVGPGFGEGSGWTLGGGAEDVGSGIQGSSLSLASVKIPVDGYIKRAFHFPAFEEEALEYQIQIDATLYGPGLGDLLSTNSVTMQASVEDGEDVIQTWPEWTVKNTAATFRYTANGAVSGGGSLDGDFYLRVTDSEGAGVGALVSRVCIQNKSGNHWPGYENYDIPPDGNFAVLCTECVQPPEGDPLWAMTWLAYLGCMFRNLIYCTLLGLFNNLIEFVRGIVLGLGYLVLWLSAVMQSAFRALVGWLLATIIPLYNAFLETPLGRFLWDAVVLGRLIFLRLMEILAWLVQAYLYFLGVLRTMFQTLLAFRDGMIDAINADPAGVTYFSCSSGPLMNMCVGLGLVDSVMADIPVLSYVGFLAAGVYVVYTVVWIMRQINSGIEATNT